MQRHKLCKSIEKAFSIHPIVALLGPRQCGKTTFAKQFIKYHHENLPRVNYFDLEDVQDLNRLANSQLTLNALTGLIVIDEIQRFSELFPTLRVLVDKKKDQKFLILGSASRDLIKQSSESLAGRIAYLEITPFSFSEVVEETNLWIRGGFPRSYLAKSAEESWYWREAYVQTFLERDIPNLGIKIPPHNLRRFWLMLSHYHGNICNYSELGRSLNLNHKTLRGYSDLLTGTFMIRQLQPWFENIEKRQIKSHKIYVRDSGILHTLLNIPNKDALLMNPKLGSSWEGFMLEEIIRYHQARPEECFFWSTQSNAEIDLLIVKGMKKYAYEFKYSPSPKMGKSMHIAIEDLKLDKITVFYPGNLTFSLHEKVVVTNLKDYLQTTGRNWESLS